MPGARRGEVWWLDLPEAEGSDPGGSRPVLVLQADSFNRSQIATVVVAAITSNLLRAAAPGNVRISAAESGLAEDSVVNVSQILTVDKAFLRDKAGHLPEDVLRAVGRGAALVLGLKLAE